MNRAAAERERERERDASMMRLRGEWSPCVEEGVVWVCVGLGEQVGDGCVFVRAGRRSPAAAHQPRERRKRREWSHGSGDK